VGPRANPEVVAERKNHSPAGKRNLVAQPDA